MLSRSQAAFRLRLSVSRVSIVGAARLRPRTSLAPGPAPPFHSSTRRHFTGPSATLRQSQELPKAPFPIFTTVNDFRTWRKKAEKEGKTVGFVPTMGALHDGHLSLVKASLAENDLTVVSIFVNPAQFAPTEDLAAYPRTLPSDIEALEKLAAGSATSSSSSSSSSHGGIAAIFAPTVTEMYPSPDGKAFTQHVADQVGAFVEVHGLQHEMEGASRPTFFRGVATVCTKLFHIVAPHRAYFGQKDIQQAILLRRLVLDLCFAHPEGPEAVRVLPTSRDAGDGLALSSRNAYLTQKARSYATALYKALQAGQTAWEQHVQGQGQGQGRERVAETLERAREVAQQEAERAAEDDIQIDVLYISLNDPISLGSLEGATGDGGKRGAILSGAAMIKDGPDGRATRLIDNVLLGFAM